MTDKVAQLNYWNNSNWRTPWVYCPSLWHDIESERKSKYASEMVEIEEGDNLLVLGCGPGYELWEFAEKLKKGTMICTEPSDLIYKAEKVTDMIKEKYGTEIILVKEFAEDFVDIIDEDFSNVFDNAIGIDVHRYLQDPIHVYSKTMNLIKEDGGIVLVNTVLYGTHDCFDFIRNKAYDIEPFKKLNSEHHIGVSQFNHKIREFLLYLQKNVPEEVHTKNLKKIEKSKNIPQDIIQDVIPEILPF
ncbi:MAG: class I SAM-dependent methyltransferase [Candidatus Aenigmarchaeota archaeon]|nr:class I SAM-dependent methyltransferase [Candidatus Aenigmarchaeota archaeon]